MTSGPASSSRPAIRPRMNDPWWTKSLRSRRGASRHELQVAAGGLVDAAEASTERHVRRLDRIEEQGPVGASVLDEQEGRIAFELHQPEWRFETTDDRLEKVAGDDRRVLDLTPGEIGGIARQVGDDQEAGLGCRCHARHARPWSRSNVKTLWPPPHTSFVRPAQRHRQGRRGDPDRSPADPRRHRDRVRDRPPHRRAVSDIARAGWSRAGLRPGPSPHRARA